jgi:nucleotide sugar dehydrogenase
MYTIGIVGYGYVGKSTHSLIPSNCEVMIYDIEPEICVPKNTTIKDLVKCDVIFVSVPTPMNKDGSCHTDIVNLVIKQLHKENIYNIIVRSTVPVGFCNENKCFFMPEFITEKNWKDDVKNTKDWIIGTKNDIPSNIIHLLEVLQNILNKSKEENKIKDSNLIIVQNEYAEIAKLTRNCILATKVAFLNEINKFCEKKDMKYNKVRELMILDSRIGESHTSVPGHDGEFGFGGTCFVKDIWSLKRLFKENKVESPVIDAVIHRNENIDRKSRSWENMQGRAVI